MQMANELDLALHILYTAVDNYPCNGCEFGNACESVRQGECVIKKAFDAVHVEILRKEETNNDEQRKV